MRQNGGYLNQEANDRSNENGRVKGSPVLSRDQNRIDFSRTGTVDGGRSKSSSGFSCCGRTRGESPYTHHTPVNPTANYPWSTWNGSSDKTSKTLESRNGLSNELSHSRSNNGSIVSNDDHGRCDSSFDKKFNREWGHNYQSPSPALHSRNDKLPATKPPLPPVSSQVIIIIILMYKGIIFSY